MINRSNCYISSLRTTFLTFSTFLLPLSSHAFTLTGVASNGGWDDVNRSQQITTVIDTSDFTSDISSSAVNTGLMNAYNNWDNISSAPNLNFSYLSDQGGNYDVFDGDGGSLDQSSNWNYANITMGGFLSGEYFQSLSANGNNILAVTWTGKLSGGGNRNKKSEWHSDIFFNDSWNWTVDGNLAQQDFEAGLGNRTVDLETVATHEIGHALGFGHENSTDSVMASYYNGVQRELFPDDLLAAEFLYSNALKGGGGGSKRGRGPNFSFFDSMQITSILFGEEIDLDLFNPQFTVTTPVPEPCSIGLFLSAAGAAYLRRRGKR